MRLHHRYPVGPDLRAMALELGGVSRRMPNVRFLRTITLLFIFGSALHAAPASRNLFAELLSKSEAEITAKIDRGFDQLFHGRDADQRVYYPIGDDEAYIADIGNQDVRSEGMS